MRDLMGEPTDMDHTYQAEVVENQYSRVGGYLAVQLPPGVNDVRHVTVPQTGKLTNADLAAHVPPCHFCGQPIPPERASSGRYKTCSEEHARLLRQWNRFKKGSIRCKACLRPSTPEERAEFKAWRKETKGLKAQGRPAVGRNRAIREALVSAKAAFTLYPENGDFGDAIGKIDKALKLVPEEEPVIASESI